MRKLIYSKSIHFEEKMKERMNIEIERKFGCQDVNIFDSHKIFYF